MKHIALLSLLATASCVAHKLSTVRSTVSAQTGCPETRLNVVEYRDGWAAEGCDTRYFCQATSGPCAEDPTLPQRLARTREVFARETGCPLADVTVGEDPQGFAAWGCGRYSVCVSYQGPCMPSQPPTCSELARRRYDHCVNVARRDGNAGREESVSYAGWSSAAVIAGAVTSTVEENRMLDECRSQFDAESRRCSGR